MKLKNGNAQLKGKFEYATFRNIVVENQLNLTRIRQSTHLAEMHRQLVEAQGVFQHRVDQIREQFKLQ